MDATEQIQSEPQPAPFIALIETPERLAELVIGDGSLWPEGVTEQRLADGFRSNWATCACLEYDGKCTIFRRTTEGVYEFTSSFPMSQAEPEKALQLALHWIFVASPCVRLVTWVEVGSADYYNPERLGFEYEYSTDGSDGPARHFYGLNLDKWITRQGYGGPRMFFVDCFRAGNSEKGWDTLNRWAIEYDSPEILTAH